MKTTKKNILLKVILETGELKEERFIEKAAFAALEGGADFLKTSTGKVPINATLEAAKILLKCVKEYAEKQQKQENFCTKKFVGIKIAGGVKTLQQAAEYMLLAAKIMGPDYVNNKTFRFGSSSLLNILRKNVS